MRPLLILLSILTFCKGQTIFESIFNQLSFELNAKCVSIIDDKSKELKKNLKETSMPIMYLAIDKGLKNEKGEG